MEDDLELAGFVEELISDLIFTRLSPFLTLEKAASSILLLALEVLLEPEERLVAFSGFSPIDEALEGSEVTFLLRPGLEV